MSVRGGVLLTLAIGLMVGPGLAGWVFSYYAYQYPIDQANGYIDLAAATNNLTETLRDLNQTLTMLEPYHGNPNLMFPTSHTNFDLIKQQISTTIQAAEKLLNLTPDSYAYQQALHNIQGDLTSTVEGELQDAGGARWYWSYGWTEWIWWISGFALVVSAIVFWRY